MSDPRAVPGGAPGAAVAPRSPARMARSAVDEVVHALLVGGNNVGKSTVCEALELALSPDRQNRFTFIGQLFVRFPRPKLPEIGPEATDEFDDESEPAADAGEAEAG